MFNNLIPAILITISFIVGYLTPSIARYFSKIYPCTMPKFLFFIPKWIKFKITKEKRRNSKKLKQLKIRKFLWQISLGLLSSIITYYIYKENFINNSNTPLLFILIIWFNLFILTIEIDRKYFLIPDIITFPLILLSFLIISYKFYSNYTSELFLKLAISPVDSSLGGLYGYIVGTLASLILYKKYPEGFGGGDIKILASIGSILGLTNTYKVIGFSVLFFGIISILKKEKSLAYAPVLFLSFLYYIFIY